MTLTLEDGSTLETYIIEQMKVFYETDEDTWQFIFKKAMKDFSNDASLEGAFDKDES